MSLIARIRQMLTRGDRVERPEPDLIDQVRRILLDDWDPLGVGGTPSLSDEYDCMLGVVIAKLRSSPDKQAVVDLLLELEADHLGLSEPQADHCEVAAEKLVALRARTADWPAGAEAAG